MKIEKEYFGHIDGVAVDLFSLVNDNEMKIQLSNYGGIITSVRVPDKNGCIGEVVMGFDNLEGYLKSSPYFGSIVGRYGNRIAKGRFELEGQQYKLAINNGQNHLHGGLVGFDKVLWAAEEIIEADQVGIQLKYTSKDGEEGYPGNLSIKLTYSLTNENELKINYFATTDKTTVCNLTNHSYFNLKDGGETSVINHEMKINADSFLPIDETSIPLGHKMSVEGTPFDFKEARPIADSINEVDEQLKFGLGFDHNFILNGELGKVQLVAEVSERTSGRMMEVYTDQPGLQFYTGNYLNGSVIGKNGISYQHRNALCLETQHYPDSPNQPEFPATTLKPNEKYQSATIYKFKTI